MTKLSLTLWRVALLLLAGLLSWRILATNLAAYYADRLQAGDRDAVEHLLTWQPDHPRALYAQGTGLAAADPEAALETLARAYRANPTDPQPLLAIAALYIEQERTEDADALMRIADRLTPVDPSVQQQLAVYWDRRGDTPAALQHLSKAMAAHPRYRPENYPVMLGLAEDPALRALLEPVALESPAWWPGFFRYAASKAPSTEVVRYLFDLGRRAAGDSLTEDEQLAYQNRLLRDGFAVEAYLAWLNTLEPAARKQLGLLFNGGFELPLSNAGFDWRTRPHKQLDIRPLRTLGTSGAASLMVRFNGFDERFNHLSQVLLLQPGPYRLSGAARVDDLKTHGGVRWQVRCRGTGNKILGESQVFLGAAEWGEFSFDFEVPGSDCNTQELRLVSAGTHNFELAIDGVLWFDNLRIERTVGLDAAAGADHAPDTR